MAARKNSNASGVSPAELERVQRLVKEHEENGRTDTYWHGVLARLEAAQTTVEPKGEPLVIEEKENESEVTDGTSN